MIASWMMPLALLTLSGTCVAATPSVELDRIEGGTLHFKEGKPLTTPLRDVQFLGALQTEASPGSPYLLVTAKPCQDCMEERSVYLLSRDGSHSFHFVHPGRIIDSKTRAVVLEARAFYGKCLADWDEVYVVYQKDTVDKKKHGRRFKSIEPSIFVAEPSKDGIREKLSEIRSIGQLAAKQKFTLSRVKGKQCVEIAGRDRMMLNKPLDLRPRRDTGDDVEDEDAQQESKADTATPDEKTPADSSTPAKQE